MIKYMLLLFLLSTCVVVVQGQTKGPLEDVVITSKKKITR